MVYRAYFRSFRLQYKTGVDGNADIVVDTFPVTTVSLTIATKNDRIRLISISVLMWSGCKPSTGTYSFHYLIGPISSPQLSAMGTKGSIQSHFSSRCLVAPTQMSFIEANALDKVLNIELTQNPVKFFNGENNLITIFCTLECAGFGYYKASTQVC